MHKQFVTISVTVYQPCNFLRHSSWKPCRCIGISLCSLHFHWKFLMRPSHSPSSLLWYGVLFFDNREVDDMSYVVGTKVRPRSQALLFFKHVYKSFVCLYVLEMAAQTETSSSFLLRHCMWILCECTSSHMVHLQLKVSSPDYTYLCQWSFWAWSATTTWTCNMWCTDIVASIKCWSWM